MSEKGRMFNPFAYGSPKPEFDARKICPDFETVGASCQERDTRIKCLKQFEGIKCRELAKKLQQCGKGRRCLSPTCPCCSRQFRLWFVERVMILLAEDELIFVTIIPSQLQIPTSNLHELVPKRIGDMLRQQMARVGLAGQIVGGIDGEYDEQKRVWRPHFHLIAPASSRRLFHHLRERFYSNPNGAYRPLHTQAVNNLLKAASYCAKAFWPSRRSYIDQNGNPRTVDRRLGRDLQSDWLVWRAGFRLEDFLFLYGVRRYGHELRPIAVSDKLAKDEPKGLVEHLNRSVALKE